MTELNALQTHEILVAAAIAQQHGFDETGAALQHMAKCSMCTKALQCSGVICDFVPKVDGKPPLH